MGRFDGRNVIVTGGNRGIGRAIVDRLASEGADVMVVARNAETIDATVRSVEERGGKAWGHHADLTRSGEVRSIVAAATARWPRIEVLVNNAGIGYETPFLEIPEEQWDEVIATNLRAPFLLSQLVAREMAATGGGAIVHIASIDASGGDGPYASYNASKAGLLGLNRTMAIELAPHGIRVVSLHPTGVDTPLNDGLAAMEGATPLEIAERSAGNLLPVPWIEPRDVAEALRFLVSDRARYVTGTAFVIDAGLLTR
jgi:NAD(P)-dependent dehydrogenase (short-subunit alcohol dehydrogenase family)